MVTVALGNFSYFIDNCPSSHMPNLSHIHERRVHECAKLCRIELSWIIQTSNTTHTAHHYVHSKHWCGVDTARKHTFLYSAPDVNICNVYNITRMIHCTDFRILMALCLFLWARFREAQVFQPSSLYVSVCVCVCTIECRRKPFSLARGGDFLAEKCLLKSLTVAVVVVAVPSYPCRACRANARVLCAPHAVCGRRPGLGRIYPLKFGTLPEKS